MKKKSHFSHTAWHGKPYNFFGDILWDTYKCRVLKLPINAGLTCPNRDGTLDVSGCIFCSEEGSASPTASGTDDIIEQMEIARKNFKRADALTRYIAYFQAFTNTRAPVDELKKLYDHAISKPDVIGLMIGTRPDCLPDEVLDLIASYKKENFELMLELGVQTVHDKSLEFLRRHHDYASSRDAIMRSADRGIPVCAHVILGIPGETWEDMMATSDSLAALPVAGVKIHHLHVIKDTPLESLYRDERINLLSLKEYTSTLCDFIERLRPDMIIHRLHGDREEKTLIAPAWGMHKGTVIKTIEDEFIRRGTRQGFLWNDE